MQGLRYFQLVIATVLAWVGVALSLVLHVLGALGLDVVDGLLVLWPLAFLVFGASIGLSLWPKRQIYVTPWFPWRYLRGEIGPTLTWMSLGALVYGLAAIMVLVALESVLVGEVHGDRFYHNGASTIATATQIQAEHARVAWGFSAAILSTFLTNAFIATERLRRARR